MVPSEHERRQTDVLGSSVHGGNHDVPMAVPRSTPLLAFILTSPLADLDLGSCA